MSAFTFVDRGSVTTPAGFKAAGITAGLKRSGKPDMALLFSDVPASAAGCFTSCVFAAAPVQVDREVIAAGKKVRGVIVNSGNANACTGLPGIENARRMCAEVARLTGCAADEIMVSSTGRIGVGMPMDIINCGIEKAVAALTDDGGLMMSEAIMTTDTRPKSCAVRVVLSNGEVFSIGGCTKGAGMIAPGLVSPGSKGGLHATMLCYLTTDAEVDRLFLQTALQTAADHSFNRISIDGDMSTNDTVLLLANGCAGVKILSEDDRIRFVEAVTAVAEHLAREMVMDGEGVTKFVKVCVNGARDDHEARLAVNAVCNSLLCKTAWFGGDPNWGRVMAAVGYSGAQFDQLKVNMDYDDQPVVCKGQAAPTAEARLAQVIAKREFTITVNLNAGEGAYWMYTADLSYEYVKINAEYFT